MDEKMMQRIEDGRQYRNFAELMAVRTKRDGEELPEEEKVVEGHFTTFNQPYMLYKIDNIEVWEQVDKGAFDETDMEDVIFQYDHKGRVFARISNGTLEIEKDETGMLCRANLGGTQIGRELYEEIQNGYTTKMSFGFTITKENNEWEEMENGIERVTFTIQKVGKLYDVSAVSLPANDGTDISARGLRDGEISRHKAERLEERAQVELAKAKARAELEF